MKELRGSTNVSPDVEPAFVAMERSLAELKGFDAVLADVQEFIDREWSAINDESDLGHLSRIVQGLFTGLRNKGTFPTLRRAVEIVSDFVREGFRRDRHEEFLDGNKYQAGDVRQVFYRDLLGGTSIGLAKQREREIRRPSKGGKWICYEKDEIRQTLSMYGKNFLFLDRVVMEESGLRDGFVGFGRFTVPTPEENPILKDHFVGNADLRRASSDGGGGAIRDICHAEAPQRQETASILTGTEFRISIRWRLLEKR